MGSPTDEILRLGYAEAVRVVQAARTEAETIRAEAQRSADLTRVRAEADAAASRNTGELYLEKARAVLEIAQRRAQMVPAPQVIDLREAEGDGPAAATDLNGADPDASARGRLPGELDRLVDEAVQHAVDRTITTSRSRTTGR